MNDRNGALIKALILLFVFIIGIFGYVLYFNGFFDRNTDNIKKGSDDNIEKNVKERLSKFVSAASFYSDTGYSSTAQNFINGTTSIDNDIKYKMTYNVIYKIDQDYKSDVVLTTEESNAMKRVFNDDINGESLDIIKLSLFNKTYEELFNEKPSYTINNLTNIGCPAPLGYNIELDRIYLFYRCDGNSYSEYDSFIASYDEDDKYYYVHQEGGFKTQKEESDIIVYKILWKFDKKFNFVSTSKE